MQYLHLPAQVEARRHDVKKQKVQEEAAAGIHAHGSTYHIRAPICTIRQSIVPMKLCTCSVKARTLSSLVQQRVTRC